MLHHYQNSTTSYKVHDTSPSWTYTGDMTIYAPGKDMSIRPPSRHLLVGLFEPTVMTFGLCNAPATFQTFMNNIFADMIDKGYVIVYLDDILIFSDDPAHLDKLTYEVLSQLKKHDLYLRPEKCMFAQTSIESSQKYVSKWTQPSSQLSQVVWPTPHTVKQLQAFLGFCNFYQWFIKDCMGSHHHGFHHRPPCFPEI